MLNPSDYCRGLLKLTWMLSLLLIDKVIMNHTNEDIIEEVANQVNEMMSERIFVF
jgi:glycine hydroxymethyltransferase